MCCRALTTHGAATPDAPCSPDGAAWSLSCAMRCRLACSCRFGLRRCLYLL